MRDIKPSPAVEATKNRSYEQVVKEPVAITPVEISRLQEAYDHLNRELFEGKLPDVFITYQRKANMRGHFAADRYSSRVGESGRHELALNPDSFVERTDAQIVSTLGHEQTHVWQHSEGTPSARGYHNKQWATKMKEIGLQPSSTGAVGGKETGQRMTHYIIPRGRFEQAFNKLAATGWKLHLQSAHQSGAKGRDPSKTLFICPSCGWKIRGKPDTGLICLPCFQAKYPDLEINLRGLIFAAEDAAQPSEPPVEPAPPPLSYDPIKRPKGSKNKPKRGRPKGSKNKPINHALVLGSNDQGIGKDTMIEPVKRAVGAWNFDEVSPSMMMGEFTGFLRNVILRINEARDLGDVNRYKFYDHMKGYLASPPDVLRVNEKFLREYDVLNCVGPIITTNHKTDGIFLPPEDRRHYVAWSESVKQDFDDGYWKKLWSWYDAGGDQHVAAYLMTLDISDFDPKAPPPKTEAFWSIVDANRAPEEGELADALDKLGNPDALTLAELLDDAGAPWGRSDDFCSWLRDRKNRRAIPHRFEAAGYVPVRNSARDTGLWVVAGVRQVVYAKQSLSLRDQLKAVAELQRRAEAEKREADARAAAGGPPFWPKR